MQDQLKANWEIRDGIGIITITNPPENYLAEPEFVPLDTLKSWTADPLLKGIIIHGQGKHFSAGGDLKRIFKLAAGSVGLEASIVAGIRVIEYLIGLDLPLVAAIRGVCFGGGLEIALACHIRIAADNALFASPETSHGLIPGMGGTVRLASTVGQAHALRMILTGDMVNAEEARILGLIDTIVPRHEVLNHAFNLLRKMTDTIPVQVIRSVIQTLRNAQTMPAEEAIAEENKIFCRLAKQEAQRRAGHSEKEREDE